MLSQVQSCVQATTAVGLFGSAVAKSTAGVHQQLLPDQLQCNLDTVQYNLDTVQCNLDTVQAVDWRKQGQATL